MLGYGKDEVKVDILNGDESVDCEVDNSDCNDKKRTNWIWTLIKLDLLFGTVDFLIWLTIYYGIEERKELSLKNMFEIESACLELVMNCSVILAALTMLPIVFLLIKRFPKLK